MAGLRFRSLRLSKNWPKSTGQTMRSEDAARPETPGITWARSWQTCVSLFQVLRRIRGDFAMAPIKMIGKSWQNHGKIMKSSKLQQWWEFPKFFIGKSSTNGSFSVAMLNWWTWWMAWESDAQKKNGEGNFDRPIDPFPSSVPSYFPSKLINLDPYLYLPHETNP